VHVTNFRDNVIRDFTNFGVCTLAITVDRKAYKALMKLTARSGQLTTRPRANIQGKFSDLHSRKGTLFGVKRNFIFDSNQEQPSKWRTTALLFCDVRFFCIHLDTNVRSRLIAKIYKIKPRPLECPPAR
jgi:hypothetical protein